MSCANYDMCHIRTKFVALCVIAYKRGGGSLLDSKGKQGAGRIARGKHEINLGETTKLRSRADYRIVAHSNKVKRKNVLKLDWGGT